MSPSSKFSKLTCWNCHQQGHKSSNCRGADKRVCYRCKQTGHTAAICRKQARQHKRERQAGWSSSPSASSTVTPQKPRLPAGPTWWDQDETDDASDMPDVGYNAKPIISSYPPPPTVSEAIDEDADVIDDAVGGSIADSGIKIIVHPPEEDGATGEAMEVSDDDWEDVVDDDWADVAGDDWFDGAVDDWVGAAGDDWADAAVSDWADAAVSDWADAAGDDYENPLIMRMRRTMKRTMTLQTKTSSSSIPLKPVR